MKLAIRLIILAVLTEAAGCGLQAGIIQSRHWDLNETILDTTDVRSSKTAPENAWLKVPYRGSWYFIPATDLNSRTSFTLLSALFASVVGEVPGAKPVLTLPVN